MAIPKKAQEKTSDDGLLVDLRNMPFQCDGGIAEQAAIGLIVLASDQTVEHEFRKIIDMDGVAFYESRIYNSATITPETLKDMEGRITASADLILPGLDLDVVAFGCTSASMVIGEERVFELIREVRPEAKTTTPITAALAAFRALGAERIALLTPYRDDINRFMRDYIEERGLSVPVMGSFNEENDNTVGRIDLASVRQAALELGRHDAVDCVFVSCTAVRLAEVARDIESELGKAVTSSNHAMAWHCLRLSGVETSQPEWGRLFELGLPD